MARAHVSSLVGKNRLAMKILYISQLLPFPLHSGAMLRNNGLIKQLAKNHQVHLVTFNQQALIESEEDLARSIRETQKFCPNTTVFKIPTDGHPILWRALLALNLFSSAPYSIWRFFSFKMWFHLKKLAATESFDIVHIDTIALLPYRRLFPNTPVVLNHQNVESLLMSRRAESEDSAFARFYVATQARKLKAYEKRMLPLCQGHTCCSELDGEELARIAPGIKIGVVPNGTDTDYFTPLVKNDCSCDSGDNTAVFVGGLSWYPNTDGLLYFCKEILPQVLESLENFQLFVIGAGHSDKLQSYAQLFPQIKILGKVDDIRPLVGAAKVFIVPLRVGGGTRLKILDAMAMGKAIVSTSIGAEGLLLTNLSDILLADTPAEFASRVAEVCSNAELRQDLELNARETVKKKYSWNVIGTRLESFYQKVLENRRTQ